MFVMTEIREITMNHQKFKQQSEPVINLDFAFFHFCKRFTWTLIMFHTFICLILWLWVLFLTVI